MVLFPEVQRLAQKEIDQVVGGETLPEMEHFSKLPYIRGVVKESLRCLYRSSRKVALLFSY